jgi:hypothetical protein
MNIYSIYTYPNDGFKEQSPKKMGNILFIRQGFSVWAAIFNVFWAAYNKLWMIFVLLIILTSIVSAVPVFHMVSVLLNIAFIFLFGFFAPEILEYYAQKRGYELADIVLAENEEVAEVKYLSRIDE